MNNTRPRRGSTLVSIVLGLQLVLATPVNAQDNADPIEALIPILTQILLDGGISQLEVDALIANLEDTLATNQELQASLATLESQLVQTLCATGEYLDGNGTCTAGSLVREFGNANTAMGDNALQSNTTGAANTATGRDALSSNTSGDLNTATGIATLSYNTSGRLNTATGVAALENNTTGNFNTATGYEALENNTTGNYNTATGFQALDNHTTGNDNTALGFNAGSANTTGSNNLYLDNAGATEESETIRIGDTQSRTFIRGIRGVTPGISDAIPVFIDSIGQLGTASSSRRYKQDIYDMDEASSGLLQLRPVTYRYKEAYADGNKPIQYGLIAEEVAKVYPDLVVYNADGEVETVQYRKLVTMLLNELQKQYRANEAQTVQLADLRVQVKLVQTQYQQLQDVTARLARLEAQTGVLVAQNE